MGRRIQSQWRMLFIGAGMLLLFICSPSSIQGAGQAEKRESFFSNWFLQFGADWTLQKPYGHAFSQSFSKGSSYGLEVAVGRLFTRELSFRGKATWDNGLIDSRAEWLAPFNQPGVNHDRGGFVSVVGDALFNLNSIFGRLDSTRPWNISVFLRAGGVYNFGADKGSPLIGIGLSNSFRISELWGLYADVACNGVSSGFSMDPSASTGIGSGSNMYFTLDVGATYRLGGKSSQDFGRGNARNSFRDRSFWRNWFLQMGMDMTLLNPCEKDFRNVFPDGYTTGVDLSLGKWFSPLAGVRGRLNIENFLIENKKLKWLPYDEEKHKSSYDGGGCILACFDFLFSMKHAILGYRQNDLWDLYAFPRMGLGRNVSISSMSPLVGAGVGCTYRFSKIWSLYFDTAYEGITSEYFDGISWSGPTGAAFNGIWDINLGVQLNIGEFGF